MRGRKPVLRLLGPGLAEHDGEAVLTAQADPRTDPLLVLRMAARAARAGLPLSPSSVDRLVADSPAAAASPGRRTPAHLFVELLGAGPPLVPVWEALDQAGLIARLLPEWDLVRHRPQRNAVHRYSRRPAPARGGRAGASPLVREVHRPDLLLVGALLHDIGKGSETAGDHSEAGEPLAVAVATRMGFDADDVATLALVVRHHLLLVETATRRDLDDPATVTAVADALGTTEVLELMAALTRADALATGPAAWSEWKAGLVDDLVRRTALRLHGAPAAAAAAADPGAGRPGRGRPARRGGRAGRGGHLDGHRRGAGPHRAVRHHRRRARAAPAVGALGAGAHRGRAWRSTSGPSCPTATTSRGPRRCATTSPARWTATST